MTERTGAPCANCGTWIEQSFYLTSRGYYVCYQKKYCSATCRKKVVSKQMSGRTLSKQHRQNISDSRKQLFSEGKLKPWTLGKKRTVEDRRTISQARRGILGKKWANHTKMGIQTTPIVKLTKHNEDTLRLIPLLENEGFVCVPTIKPLPDIIAFKDGLIVAIELEHGAPNWNKYQQTSHYDKVIWIRDNWREVQELKTSKVKSNKSVAPRKMKQKKQN